MASAETIRPAISSPGLSVKGRRLGQLRPAPKAIYFIYLPLLLLSVSLLTWILPTDSMLLVSSIAGSAAGAYTLWDLVFRRAPLRISNVLAMTLLLGYCAGAANSWLTVPRAGLTLASFFFRDTAAVSRGMASVLLACGILYCVGEIFEKPIFGEEFRVPLDNRTYVLIVAGTGLMVLAYVTGATGYMGAVTGSSGQLSIFSAFSDWFSSALFALSICVFFNTPKGFQRTIIGALVAVQILLLVPLGRRVLLFAILLAIFALRFGEHRFRLSFVKKAVYGAAAVAVFMVGSTAFYYLRVAGNATHGTLPFMQRAQMAVELRETRNPAEIDALIKKNVEKRTFILGYLSDLLDASEKSPPAMGQDLVGMIKLVIPSALLTDKDRSFQEETLADETWGFSYVDEANSVLTAGAMDFGLIGIILYPLLIVFMLRGFIEIVGAWLPPLTSLVVALATLGIVLETEIQISGYFSAIRDGILFAILISILSLIPRFRWRRSS